MQYTTNYNLNLPELKDQYNLSHTNDNSEAIDTELKKNADAITTEVNKRTSETKAIREITDQTLKASLINLVYRKGFYLWTDDSTFDPNTDWGVGTWVRVQDKIIVAKGSLYTKNIDASDLDGNGELRLSVAQLPSHNHTYSGTTTNTGSSHSHSINDPGHAHTVTSVSNTKYNGSNLNWNVGTTTRTTSKEYTGITINNGGSHTHTFSGTTDSTGSGSAIKPLPPIEVAYCWKRTA